MREDRRSGEFVLVDGDHVVALDHRSAADPVAALVLGAAPPLELLLVGGRPVVERDHVVTVDEHELTRSAVLAHRSLLARASTVTCKEGTAS